MCRIMQIVADDGVLCHEAGIAIHKNPYLRLPLLSYAWETGWKEAAFVSQSKNQSRAK